MDEQEEAQMSGYRVFGVSVTSCRRAAEKAIRPGVLTSQAKAMDSWTERVEEETARLFAKQKARKAISPLFSSPVFAKDWLVLAGATVRNCEIRGHVKTGRKRKNGAPEMKWVPLDKIADFQAVEGLF